MNQSHSLRYPQASSPHGHYHHPHHHHHTYAPPHHHQHSYHPYRPRSLHHQPAPVATPPPRHNPHHRPASLLPPIDSLTNGPPPLARNSGPRQVGSNNNGRHSSDLRRYQFTSEREPSPTYNRYPSPESVGRRHSLERPSFIKQEPREYHSYSPIGFEHRRKYVDNDIPLTPVSAKFDSPAMAPIDPRDRALERLPHLHISDSDVEANPKSRFDVFDAPVEYRGMSASERRFLQTMPVQHPRQVIAYPLKADHEPMNIDPALSSVRSSADGTGVEVTPEIRIQPETLAAAAPSLEVHTADSPMDDGLSAPVELDENGTPIKKDTPFSRSPELRVSHKLAERKRRKEMRDLFDELRETLPADRGMKASKWEILSKAVDYINHLKNQVNDAHRTVELLHRDLAALRGENPANWPPSYPHFAAAISQYVPPHTGATTPAAAAQAAAAPAPAATVPAPVAAPAVPAVAAAVPAAVPAPAPAAAAPAPVVAAAVPVAAPAADVVPAAVPTVTTPAAVPAAEPAVAEPPKSS